MHNDDYSIVVENLSKHFGKFKAVDDISFNIKKGEIFGFLGPNGSGKSTTIRMLCGLLTPTSGKALVNNYDIWKESHKIKLNIGYMAQKFSLYEDLTVSENIDFWGTIYKMSKQHLKQRKEEIIYQVGLSEIIDMFPKSLPSGWRQKISLACAILHEPAIIFLDEPTGGVDPVSRRNFWDIIHTLSSDGKTILVTTHFLDEAEYCNNLGMIYYGKYIASGSPFELKSRMISSPIFEIKCEPLIDALNLFKNISLIIEASLFASSIHIVISSESLEFFEDEIRKQAKIKSISIHSIERVLPTLEDFFVSIIQKEMKNAEKKE